MLHKMKLKHKYFEKIYEGKKTIEMRLNDEKRQKIKVGDFIEFTDLETNEKLITQVIALHKFQDFSALYSHFNKTQLGYDKNDNADPTDMAQFYSAYDISRYGVVGIEICLK